MICKFNKYVKADNRIGVKYSSHQFDINKFEYQKSTLRLNMLLGNTDKCDCSECNPDTSSNIGTDVNLRTNYK